MFRHAGLLRRPHGPGPRRRTLPPHTRRPQRHLERDPHPSHILRQALQHHSPGHESPLPLLWRRPLAETSTLYQIPSRHNLRTRPLGNHIVELSPSKITEICRCPSASKTHKGSPLRAFFSLRPDRCRHPSTSVRYCNSVISLSSLYCRKGFPTGSAHNPIVKFITERTMDSVLHAIGTIWRISSMTVSRRR